jgi:DNA-binding MarR family transcriptional regulator
MADIIKRPLTDAEAMTLVELMFFAYRDFVSGPDEVLSSLKFGRAHHRVLHFVGREPGMTVAQLLDTLQITKQSLSRVLKDLIDQGYVFQKEGDEDRRHRLLFLSPKGEALWSKLVEPQVKRFHKAVKELESHHNPHLRELLYHLINAENRDSVRDRIERLSIIGK